MVKEIAVAKRLLGVGGDRVLEKLLLALTMTLCLNLLVVVRLSNNSHSAMSSPLAENINTGKKWLGSIGSNWQQQQLFPIAAK